jgi:g-D-glutamyl-meso-diaminopimelate peptidase
MVKLKKSVSVAGSGSLPKFWRIECPEVMDLPIVKTDVPMTSALCEETIQALLEAYPSARSETLTVTAFGRPVRTLTLGQGARQVIFTAAHHANEWITATVLLKFMEELARAMADGSKLYGIPGDLFRRNVTVHAVPMVNPDGVDLVTGAIPPGSEEYARARILAENYPGIPFPDGWKANLSGVDLNLQYPAGWRMAREIKFAQGFTKPGPRDYVGRSPLNQPESRALAEYTEQIDPALVLAYHTQGEVIYWQYMDYHVPGARELGEEFARLSGYALEDTPYESAFAGYKDWFIRFFGRPGYTIEVGLGENPLPLRQFDKIYRDNLGILTTAALGLPGGV